MTLNVNFSEPSHWPSLTLDGKRRWLMDRGLARTWSEACSILAHRAHAARAAHKQREVRLQHWRERDSARYSVVLDSRQDEDNRFGAMVATSHPTTGENLDEPTFLRHGLKLREVA